MKETLEYVNTHSKFYNRLFKDNKIDINKINTLEDLRQIPLTTKRDLQLYNTDFICTPLSQIIDYVTTSGTLGDPVTFALTENDCKCKVFLYFCQPMNFSCRQR